MLYTVQIHRLGMHRLLWMPRQEEASMREAVKSNESIEEGLV